MPVLKQYLESRRQERDSHHMARLIMTYIKTPQDMSGTKPVTTIEEGSKLPCQCFLEMIDDDTRSKLSSYRCGGQEKAHALWLHVQLIPASHPTLLFSPISFDLIDIFHLRNGLFIWYDDRTTGVTAKFALSRCSLGLQTPLIPRILEEQALHHISINQWIHPPPPLISPTEQIQAPEPAMASRCRPHGSHSTRNPCARRRAASESSPLAPPWQGWDSRTSCSTSIS